jgi:cytochrome P450
MDAEPPLSDADLQEEVDTFMFEGHDTTSAGITWALFLLARNPNCLKKAQAEADAVLGNTKDTTPNYDQAKKELDYIGRCVKEALRLFPPVPFFARCITEDMTIDEYEIPAGTTVAVLPLLAHFNPAASFRNPTVFDPDRFLDENSKGRHPFAYIPFSAGARNCIGQAFAELEERIIIASIIHRFDVSVDPSFAPKPNPELIMRPSAGMHLSLKPRVK